MQLPFLDCFLCWATVSKKKKTDGTAFQMVSKQPKMEHWDKFIILCLKKKRSLIKNFKPAKCRFYNEGQSLNKVAD
ncbi:hypothetical protein C3733_20065 [Bacillus amyloliquefaciens]|nr:hypothetical protein C3733_20065 [Bacillus amyloliquefaciens]